MAKIPRIDKTKQKEDYTQLHEQLNEGKVQMDLCVPLQEAEEFFNQLLKKFHERKLALTLNMPVQNLIQIPRGLKADDNSFADLDEETLAFSPILISGGPKKESARIKNLLNKEIFSESDFIFEITIPSGIIYLEKAREKKYIAFLCEDVGESIVDECHRRIPYELLSQMMPILKPYITLHPRIEV